MAAPPTSACCAARACRRSTWSCAARPASRPPPTCCRAKAACNARRCATPPRSWRPRWTATTCPRGARSRDITEGDHILITHDDAGLLARAARRILDDVHDAPGKPLLRIALHRGEVRLQDTGGDSAAVTGGQAIAVAARIEPRVTPGEIWCTESFRDELIRTEALCRTVPLAAPPALAGDGEYEGFFNVRKDGSDETDIWVRLFRVEF